jgi:hypothetical protein
MHYTKEVTIDEIIHEEKSRIAYKLAEARGFGRPDEDWRMAENILNDKNWQGTGMSYEMVVRSYYTYHRDRIICK